MVRGLSGASHYLSDDELSSDQDDEFFVLPELLKTGNNEL